MPIAFEIVKMEQTAEDQLFPFGRFQLFTIGGMQLGRAHYEPGWRWSQHVGPIAGTELCEVEHVGLVISGRAVVRMADGDERIMEPGDLFSIPPSHDSWVVGDDDYVALHFLGAEGYALAASGLAHPPVRDAPGTLS
jgi:hypothetical protein